VSYRIVVGVDGSENSTRALRWAVEEAQLRDGKVTALFAWELPLIGVPGAFNRDHVEAEAKALVASQVASASADGLVEAVVAQGDPSASLIAACQRTDADLLVLGSRGREGFSGLLLGSVGQECTAYAPCPVLIVKDKRSAA
jgi:nucleotide-binding universal stress UspA family protein